VALRGQGFNGRRRFVHGFFSAEGGGFDIGEVELRNLHRGQLSSHDSHVHTTASDGERTPKQLAYEACAYGKTVVVCDHYSVSGVGSAAAEHARLIEEGYGIGGGIVAGVEFSARVDIPSLRQIRKLHILGVGVDTGNRRLNDWLADYRRLRGFDIGHALKVKGELEERGFSFHDNIEARLSCRRNVYQVLVESLFARPENRRLVERHFGLKVWTLVSRYKRRRRNDQMRRKMVKHLRLEYGDFTASKPPLEEIVGLIREAGGLAVVAHPVSSVPQMPHFSQRKMLEVFSELASLGVDGIEAYTPSHRLEVADSIAKAALDAGLLVVGGSDAHRREHELGQLAPCFC
jgi:predicted metal-dependent phosphoesterase TrpH